MIEVDQPHPIDRGWVSEAVNRLKADGQRSADTHLLRLPLPPAWPVEIYLKDESTHPTGSLKHRLARSLFLYGLCNGLIGPQTTIVEASSGSTAVSEAYFARLLGLPFVAVMAATTSPEKIALIEREGGRCHLVEDACTIYDVSRELAERSGGHYMDQFTYAERATDWRGNNNIAESIFGQLALEPHPVPEWIVVAAGTGGTSATLGRYLRLNGYPTRLCVADPDGSAFLPAFAGRESTPRPSRIEGIGRPRVEPSFVPTVVDKMVGVPDAASVATAAFLERRTGLSAGASTGTMLYATLALACRMRAAGRSGSLVSLLCDQGSRYRHSYGDPAWVSAQGWDVAAYDEQLTRAWEDGVWVDETPASSR